MSELSRSTVSLRIFGIDLNPEYITQLLGCEPTEAERKGDTISQRGGKIHIARTGSWRLSYGNSDSVRLEIKIEGLLNKLTNDMQIWEQITRDYKVDIFCGLFLDGWNEGYEISPSLMKKMGDRNLKIGFDIYGPTDSWEIERG
jgi:hypothetical protein